MKKLLICMLSLALLGAMLTACAAKNDASTAEQPSDAVTETREETKEDAEEPEEENYNTGDASLDEPRNQDGIGERELLVVSFGTSFNDSRRLDIGGIENALAEAFPAWSVRRAFTSQIIIDHVRERDGEVIDNVHEALERAVANGVKQLVVQPTHLMSGFEYNDLAEEVASYADAFEFVNVGGPLLNADKDFFDLADIMENAMKEYDDGRTAIVYMGHGTDADSNYVYELMQNVLTDTGRTNFYIGTVEAYPSVHDVVARVAAGDYDRVVLRPMMVVAGDHANNDMAGDDEDSWRSTFETAEYQTECVLEGLGRLSAIQQLYVDHSRAAMSGENG